MITEKEFDNIIGKTISKWIDLNDKKLIFFGAFVSFDDNGKVIQDRIICYGYKKALEILIAEFKDTFDEDKKDFINW